MNTLLIGNMEKIDDSYQWFQKSDEIFEISLIFSEDIMSSTYFTCEIKPISELGNPQIIDNIVLNYDIIFLCTQFIEHYKKILRMMGVNEDKIKSQEQICEYLSKPLQKTFLMDLYKNKIKGQNWNLYQNESVDVGEFTYGVPQILGCNDGTRLKIGKFCSIARDVTVLLGGNHRPDWCTTYPFNCIMNEFSYIKGHPSSHGNIIIGNDVWIGHGAKIMSGVTIGDGSVVAANACVTKDVEPYSIVGGVPAKFIKSRFNDATIEKFMEMKWWDWDKSIIWDAIPLLQSDSIEELFEFYKLNVQHSQ